MLCNISIVDLENGKRVHSLTRFQFVSGLQ
jgi:hypothetical protein